MMNDKTKDLESTKYGLFEEYNALRNEIVKRVEFRYQIVNLTLIVAGVFFTIGVQPAITSSVLLVYPLLALFLTAGWAHNGIATLEIAKYIRECIEMKTGMGWETYLKEQAPQHHTTYGSLGTISTSGLVLTTQILAVLLALIKFDSTPTEIVLLIISLGAIVLTIVLLRYATRARR